MIFFNRKCNNYKNMCEHECNSLFVPKSYFWKFLKFQDPFHTVYNNFNCPAFNLPHVSCNPRQCWIKDSISDFFSVQIRFRTPWAEFRIPKPRILDSTTKHFLDSGIQITLHGASELWTSTLCTVNANSSGQGCLMSHDHHSTGRRSVTQSFLRL